LHYFLYAHVSQQAVEQMVKDSQAMYVKIAESYQERMQNNWLRSGSFFSEDPFMMKELSICRKLAEG
jgi:hypothetical protein